MKRGFVRGREKLRKLLMAVAFIPFVLMIIISSIYAAQFSTTSQGDFDNGTYDFTYYNSTGGYVQLNVSYTKGNYTSKIFESKIIAKWINISWAEDVIPDGPYGTELPDNQTIESTANMTGNVLLMHLNNESSYDENSTYAYDFSGNGNNGTVVNATWTSDGRMGGGGFEFDGVDDYVEFGDDSDFELENFTISGWVKRDLIGAEHILKSLQYQAQGDGGISGVTFGFGSTNVLSVGVAISDSFETTSTTSTYTDTSKFYHLVATKSGTSVKIYVNGDEVKSGTISSANVDYSTTSSKKTLIGARWRGDAQDYKGLLNGTIDEVAIWNRSLSASEILDHYNLGIVKLNLTIRSCDDSACSGESWNDTYTSSPATLNVSNNTYFQYYMSFFTENSSYSPKLYNVTVNYGTEESYTFEKDFFVDYYLISEYANTSLDIESGTKHSSNPLLERREEFDPEYYGPSLFSVLKINNTWHVWYHTYNKSGDYFAFMYANSTDGVNFTRPSLGLVAYGGDSDNNMFMKLDSSLSYESGSANTFNFNTVLYDADNSNASRKYMLLYRSKNSAGKNTANLAFSGDGTNFTRYENNPIHVNTTDTCESKSIIEDDINYKVYFHCFTPYRRIALLNSSDKFINGSTTWTWIGEIKDPPDGAGGIEFYNPEVKKQNDTYLIGVGIYNDTDDGGDGTITATLLYSRDGESISYFGYSDDDYPFSAYDNLIPLGVAGEFDEGMVLPQEELFINTENKTRVYYHAINGTHGEPLGPKVHFLALIEWDLDRITYLKPNRTSAEFKTEIINISEYKSNRVFSLNAFTNSTSNFDIELLYQNDSIITNFSRDDFDTISLDSFYNNASWGNSSTLSTLPDFIKFKFYFNGSASKIYAMELRTESTEPVVTLDNPANNSGSGGNVTLNFKVEDILSINNCSLVLNNALNQTSTPIVKYVTQNFTLSNLAVGKYNWSLNCTDSANSRGNGGTRKFSVVKTVGFSGITTDLSSVNVSNITNLILDVPSHGKINFSQSVDLSSGGDLDVNVNISNNRIYLNSTALAALNKSAVLYLYNLTFSNPRILKDGAVCSSAICTEVSYSSGELVFNVSSFSVYSAEETPSSSSSSGGSGGSSAFSSYLDLMHEISDRELEQGYTKDFREGQRIVFVLEDGEHYVKVVEIAEEYVKIEVASRVQEAVLVEGGIGFFDLDDDGRNDLKVKLNKVVGKRASLSVQKVLEDEEDEGEEIVMEGIEKAEGEENLGSEDGETEISDLWLFLGVVLVVLVVFLVMRVKRKG